MRFWMCWTHWNALNKSISVALAYYDKIKNFIKIPCQNTPQKRAQNRGLGDQGSDFWGFGRVFEESDFWWVFERRKVGLKSTKLAAWGGHGANARRFGAGSAGRAVATGGFWSLTGTGKSLTMRLERPAPRRGAADLKGSALPADPKI